MGDGPADARSRIRRAARAARAFLVEVLKEANGDNLPFLASAITFNILLAAVPFLLTLVAALSLTIQGAARASGVDPIAHLERSLGVLVPFLPESGIASELLADVFRRGRALGVEFLGRSLKSVGLVETAYAYLAAWLFVFAMFLLLFHYVPARRLPWRTAALAAAVTAVGWELLKAGFSVYLTRLANFESIYGNLATVIVVVLWLYYCSMAFLVGAEVAFVYERRGAAPDAPPGAA